MDFELKQKQRNLLEEKGIRYWELRKEEVETNSCITWNDKVQDLVSGKKQGYSVRVLYNDGWGFVYSEKEDQIDDTINKAIKIAKSLSQEKKETVDLEERKTLKDNKTTRCKINPKDISFEEKKNLCLENSKEMMKEKDMKSSKVTYHDFNKKDLYLNSEDSEITQEQIRTYIASTAIAGHGNEVETGNSRTGALKGFEVTKDISNMNKEAIERARLLLRAKIPKGGRFPVICDEMLTDVFIHEALGHACEADQVLNKDSCVADSLGKNIADKGINVYDDATGNNWGSYFYDDEGVPGQKTQLIKDGKLINFLTSRVTAQKLRLHTTGNARAENASSIPIVRMSNTYIQKGDYKTEEMIKDIKQGFFLGGSRGGQVNTQKGNFTFSAEYGYIIKNGELSEPVKGVSLSGKTLDILNNIDKISDKYRPGSPGMCGKDGQSVPVIGNCPQISIRSSLIGGK